MSKYNRPTDNFTRLNQSGWYNNLILDKKKILWATNDNSILVWNNKRQQLELFPIKLENRFAVHPNYSSIIFDNEGQLWVTNSGIFENQYFYRINLNDSLQQANYIGSLDVNQYVKKLPAWPTFNFKPIISHDGSIRIISNYGVFKLDKQQSQFLTDPSFDPEVHLNGADAQLTTEIMDYLKNMLPTFSSKNQVQVGAKVTECFLVDRQKNVWLSHIAEGGGAMGLTRKVPTPDYFRHYFLDYNPKNKLNPFFPVLKDKFGTVWGGATNQNKLFLNDKNGIIHWRKPWPSLPPGINRDVPRTW